MLVVIDFQDAAKLFGVPFRTIDRWERDGLVPLHDRCRGPGRGHRREVNLVGMLAIGITNRLRQLGVAVDTMRPIASFLQGATFTQLGADIATGRSLLVCDDTMARLMTRAEVSKHQWSGEFAIVLDLAHMSERIVDGLVAHGMIGSPSPAAIAAAN